MSLASGIGKGLLGFSEMLERQNEREYQARMDSIKAEREMNFQALTADQQRKFQKEQAAEQRAFQKSEREATQKYQSGEAALGRQFQLDKMAEEDRLAKGRFDYEMEAKTKAARDEQKRLLAEIPKLNISDENKEMLTIATNFGPETGKLLASKMAADKKAGASTFKLTETDKKLASEFLAQVTGYDDWTPQQKAAANYEVAVIMATGARDMTSTQSQLLQDAYAGLIEPGDLGGVKARVDDPQFYEMIETIVKRTAESKKEEEKEKEASIESMRKRQEAYNPLQPTALSGRF